MMRALSLTIFRAEREIIRDFSADIARGKILAILGPNGVGKSTLINALAGDIPFSQGSISINGAALETFSIRELAELRAVSAQHQRFPLAYTVSELLLMACSISGDEASAARAVRALDIAHLLLRKVTSLSGGEQQRVAIAMALSQDTPYLFLDEPFAAQDLESKQRIAAHLQELALTGRAIVLVAHMDEAELDWCDQVMRISAI
jgi:iron complex transport system ATP-binding protein